VNQTRTTFSRLGLCGLAVVAFTGAEPPASSAGAGGTRIVRPEGYLELEGDGGAPSARGSFSVVPSIERPAASKAESAPEDGAADPADSAIPLDDEPLPPPRKTPRETCQPISDRFSARLAVLRGNPPDGGDLDPMLQRAMFGRTALRSTATSPDQQVPELTWDDELKDLRRSYQKCLKAEGGR
jgi:hypothetical protein